MKNKLEKIKEILVSNNCDGYIVTNNSDILYLSGIKSSNIILLITLDNSYVLSDARYKFVIERQNVYKPYCITKPIIESVTELICDLGLKKVIIDPEHISHKNYMKIFKSVNLYDLSSVTKSLRIIKDNQEIDSIIKAQKISEKAFFATLKFIKEGMTTKEISAYLDYKMSEYGSEENAFSTIVVNEEESADCHGVPSDKKVKNGDLILFDFGATKNGYRNDITRTVALGYINKEKKKMYDLVLEAHKKCAEFLKPGVKCHEVHNIAVEVFKKYGVLDNFLHSLGHGVGIDIHEYPALNSKCEDVLEEGMVVTIEPGLYFENKFGIRIEDTYIITNNGCKSIANIEKSLVTI
ncbi:MAG: aminopeptidase P family protein [Ruminococcaceae bacterium]|nr:aminopeptidase P family protein [Oscillospiraceae bacterium]